MTRYAPISFAIIVCLTLPAENASADSLEEELRVCRDIPEGDARLICYDAALDRSSQYGRSTPDPDCAKPTVAGSDDAAAGAAADVPQEDLFGKSREEVERTVQEATGSEPIDSLSATVTRLQRYRYEKVLITLDNGQVWKQIDASSLRLRVGDTVDIRRAALGSFMLRKQGNNRTMRVSRER